MDARDFAAAERHRGVRRCCASLVGALPLLSLQALFMSDPYGWGMALTYGAIFVFFALLVPGWLLIVLIEWRYRIAADETYAFPLFAVISVPFLLAFFVPARIVDSFASGAAEFCITSQSVEWTTTHINPKWKTADRFILVLHGRGTIENHRFTSAYVNWTGPEPAGFGDIDLTDLALQPGSVPPGQRGSLEYVQERMSSAGIDAAELASISTDIVNVLASASRGLPLKPTSGVVDRPFSRVVETESVARIGGTIWMLVVFVVFQLVGWKTIVRYRPLHDIS